MEHSGISPMGCTLLHICALVDGAFHNISTSEWLRLVVQRTLDFVKRQLTRVFVLQPHDCCPSGV